MQNGGVVLVNTSIVGPGSTVTTAQTWNGANGCLIVSADVLPTVINLMLVGAGAPNQNRAIKVNSGAIAAAGVYPMPLPAGSYSIHVSGTSSIGLYAAIMPLP